MSNTAMKDVAKAENAFTSDETCCGRIPSV